MESEKHQDIIKQMAQRLSEHKLPYKEGAWERFEVYEAKKSKRFVLWPYLSGAAAVLLMAVVFLLNKDQYSPKPRQVTQTSRPAQNKVMENEESTTEVANPKPILTNKPALVQPTRIKEEVYVSKPTTIAVAKPVAEEAKVLNTMKKNETRIASTPLEEDGIKDEKIDTISSFTVPLSKESFAQITDKTQQSEEAMRTRNVGGKKWNVGLEIASTMSNNQVNIGGGIALAYSISPKLSISSGISYVQLDAQRGPDLGGRPSRAMNAPAPPSSDLINSGVMGLGKPSEQKTLQSISSHLTGLDIPINLSYQLTQKMYVVAGVSIFNVLEENRTNEFKSEFAEVGYADESKTVPEPKIRTLYSEEAAPEAPYEKNNFAGFLNFSVGYRIPFSKSVGFSIAPFFKLPIGTLTEQDMDLTNGGIKVRASF